jgi:GH24 family phage-related lysozyme (muramidase)
MFYMRKYVHAKKRVLPGLVRRREAEIRLYRFGFWYETQQKNQPAG